MSLYTKGPWENDCGFIFSEGCVIAEVGIDPQPIEEMLANAVLIAAAPDLLEALIDLLDYAESGWDHFPDCAIAAKNAVAKATIIQ